jgi:hypothetical protein
MAATETPAPLDFPALDGRPVTEAHARVCREQGHAAHTVNGRPTGVCPRCGHVAELASLVTVRRSSHPEFVYFTTTEAFRNGVRLGQRARHDHTPAEVDAHLAEIKASAARLGVELTIDDQRESF